MPKNSAADVIESLVTPEVRALSAYHVPGSDGLLKMDAMESPYELSADVRGEWQHFLKSVSFNRYPDPDSKALKRKIRSTYRVPSGIEMILGNGSDELIQMIAMLVGSTHRPIIAPSPSFSMYRQISKMLGCGYVPVPLNKDYSLDSSSMLECIERHDPACIFIAYPNNPTGNCFDESAIEQILHTANGLVVLDEAYFAFCRKSWMSSIQSWENLIVLRTLSKSGLAGLRLGMLFAHPKWAGELEKIRLPYNINVLTQCSAEFMLDHFDLLESQAEQIMEERGKMFAQLSKIPGLKVYPSEANFLLIQVEQASDLHQALIGEGILVKNLDGADSGLQSCLRLTVGAPDENRALVTAIKQINS
ncbi:MAG: histidinol-phosphate transaminase [Pseudomonadota bacterium]